LDTIVVITWLALIVAPVVKRAAPIVMRVTRQKCWTP
jgi:hypothetical protein